MYVREVMYLDENGKILDVSNLDFKCLHPVLDPISANLKMSRTSRSSGKPGVQFMYKVNISIGGFLPSANFLPYILLFLFMSCLKCQFCHLKLTARVKDMAKNFHHIVPMSLNSLRQWTEPMNHTLICFVIRVHTSTGVCVRFSGMGWQRR